MANYSLVINSRFKPFTYQELLAPAMQMTQAHQAVEEAYADLQTKASIWDKMANETTDPKAHAAYKKYADDLEGYAYNLSKYGLNTTSRKDMFDMRARYAKEIVPIETAFKKREEQAKEQRVALMNNPTLLLSRRAAQTSLDDYLANPNLDYEVYSGAMLTQQVAQQAQAVAKELREAKIAGKLDTYHNLFSQKYGFYPEEVLKAIQNPNDPNNNKILGQMVDSAIASSGIANWADQKTLDQARAFAVQGLWSGVGQTQAAPMNNFGTQKALEHSYAVDTQRRAQAFQASENAKTRAHQTAMQRERIRAAERAAAAKASQSSGEEVNQIPSNTKSLISQEQRGIIESNKDEWIKKKYIKIKPNGAIEVTPEGWTKVNRYVQGRTNRLLKTADAAYEAHVKSKKSPHDNQGRIGSTLWAVGYKVARSKGVKDALNYLEKNPAPGTRGGYVRSTDPFYEFVTNTVGYKGSWDNRSSKNIRNINGALNNYFIGKHGKSSDAYMDTGLSYSVPVENTRSNILSGMGKKLAVVSYTGSKGFKVIDHLTYDDLSSMELRDIKKIPTKYGIIYELVPKSGGTIQIAAPGQMELKTRTGQVRRTMFGNSINTQMEKSTNAAMADFADYATAIQTGYEIKQDEYGNNMYNKQGDVILDYSRPLTEKTKNYYSSQMNRAKREIDAYSNSDDVRINVKPTDVYSLSGRTVTPGDDYYGYYNDFLNSVTPEEEEQ